MSPALDRPDRASGWRRPSRRASPAGSSRRPGRRLAVAESWHRGPTAEPIDDPTELGPIVADLVARARPNADMDGQDRA